MIDDVICNEYVNPLAVMNNVEVDAVLDFQSNENNTCSFKQEESCN